MSTSLFATTDPAHRANRQSADVQSRWRQRGWRPPSEYRQDFEQSCQPVIYAGMIRLTAGRVG